MEIEGGAIAAPSQQSQGIQKICDVKLHENTLILSLSVIFTHNKLK